VPITAKLVSNYSWLSRAPKVTSFDVDVKLWILYLVKSQDTCTSAFVVISSLPFTKLLMLRIELSVSHCIFMYVRGDKSTWWRHIYRCKKGWENRNDVVEVALNNLLICILHLFFFTVGVIPKALADKIVAAFVRRTVLVLASATWILGCLTLYSI
jgi:hypothetical protein